jgi:hypothetical protein
VSQLLSIYPKAHVAINLRIILVAACHGSFPERDAFHVKLLVHPSRNSPSWKVISGKSLKILTGKGFVPEKPGKILGRHYVESRAEHTE